VQVRLHERDSSIHRRRSVLPVTTVTTVHEQMNHRACSQQRVWQEAANVIIVVSPDEQEKDGQAAAEHQPQHRAHTLRGVEFASLVHGTLDTEHSNGGASGRHCRIRQIPEDLVVDSVAWPAAVE
jgi:hypothetical protein